MFVCCQKLFLRWPLPLLFNIHANIKDAGNRSMWAVMVEIDISILVCKRGINMPLQAIPLLPFGVMRNHC